MDFLDDEPTPEEKQALLVQALKARMGAGQQQPQQFSPTGFDKAWGNQFMSTGDKVLAPLGQSQIQQAQHTEGMADQAKQRSLTQLIEAQRAASAEQHARSQEDIARQQLQQGRWSLSNPGTGQTYKIDGKTGAIVPVGGERERPAPRGSDLTANQIAQQFENFRKSISPDSTRKMLGQMEMSLTRAEELGALIKDPKTGKPFDLNPNNVREAYTMFAQQAQMGGQPAFGQIEHLVPDNMHSKWAELKEKYGSTPVGAGQQEFLQQLLESSARNKAVAIAEQKKLARQQFQTFADLKKYDRQKYDRFVRSTGDDPMLVNDEGAYVEPEAVPETQTIKGKTYFKNANGKWTVKE